MLLIVNCVFAKNCNTVDISTIRIYKLLHWNRFAEQDSLLAHVQRFSVLHIFDRICLHLLLIFLHCTAYFCMLLHWERFAQMAWNNKLLFCTLLLVHFSISVLYSTFMNIVAIGTDLPRLPSCARAQQFIVSNIFCSLLLCIIDGILLHIFLALPAL